MDLILSLFLIWIVGVIGLFVRERFRHKNADYYYNKALRNTKNNHKHI